MRVVIADDEVLLREGLDRLLTEAGFEVVGKVGNTRRTPPPSGAHPPRRRDRRHQDATHPHRRGAGRRRGDPPLAPQRWGCWCSPTTWTPAMRCACSSSTRAASATCSRNESPTSPSSTDALRRIARGRVRARPDHRRPAHQAAPTRGPARRAHRARAPGARADGRGPIQPGDLRPPVPQPEDRRGARQTHLRETRPARSHLTTTAACSPCSPTCGPRRADPLDRVYADEASEAW